MDEIERLKQQHKEELDLAHEVIVNLRRDLADKRIESQDAVWNDALSLAEAEVKATGDAGYDYVAYRIRSHRRPTK